MIKFLVKLLVKFDRAKLNIIATVVVNFRMCSFRNALKFPILIYGKVFYGVLDGRVEFPNGCSRGMVTMGRNLGFFGAPKAGTYLCFFKDSKLIFRGKASIAIDVNFRLTSGAVVDFGDDVRIGDGVSLYCENRITISDNTRITFGSQVCDTNFHYMEDCNSKTVPKKNKPIFIGANNWIGNHSHISKGCCTPNWCTVASGSLVNKDFSAEAENIILAGSPAKVIKRDIRRIFDINLERKIESHFANNENPYSCE